MEQGAELREYAAGSTVSINLGVEHGFELRDREPTAVATFQRQDVTSDNFDISREYAVVLRQRGIDEHQRKYPPLWVFSTLLLEGRVSVKAAPGEYRCEEVHAEFRDGRRVPFDPDTVPEMRFRIVETPLGSPRATQARFRN